MKTELTLSAGRAALLCIDLQEEHRGDPRYLVEGYDAVLANARRLQEAARRHGAAVLHAAYIVDLAREARPFHPVLADGTSAFSDKSDPLTAICAEVAPEGDETLLVKAQATAFGDSGLAELLRRGGTEWLFIAGVWTEACVDATVKDAVRGGLRVALVKDACGSGTAAMHRTGVLNLANRLYGGAVVDTGRACDLLAGQPAAAWRTQGAVPLRYGLADVDGFYDAL